MEVQTRLVKKVAKFPKVCTCCNKQIATGEAYHLEEGISHHIHSLLARLYCSECYSKHGEKKLLTGN